MHEHAAWAGGLGLIENPPHEVVQKQLVVTLTSCLGCRMYVGRGSGFLSYMHSIKKQNISYRLVMYEIHVTQLLLLVAILAQATSRA